MEERKLKYDQNGLITAVVTDYYTKDVLTVAYMNAESLAITIAEKRTCFWSRSRQELWRKGEQSGNVQHVVSIRVDCDGDALVVEVVKDGPACHLGNESCFADEMFVSDEIKQFSLSGLFKMLEERQSNPKEGSYTSYLFAQGTDKILKKVGEEATEVIIAGKGGDKKETIYELADLTYHAIVLMINMGISLNEVIDELASRHIIETKKKQVKFG